MSGVRQRAVMVITAAFNMLGNRIGFDNEKPTPKQTNADTCSTHAMGAPCSKAQI